MAFQMSLNFIIMTSWVLLKSSYTIGDWFAGFLVGAFVTLILIRFKGERWYLLRIWSGIVFFLILVKEIAIADFRLLKTVLSPKVEVVPGIIAVPTRLESDLEKAIYAATVILTPNTSLIDFSEDGKVLFVHFLDVTDKEKEIRELQQTFERKIMEVTRHHV